MNRRSTKRSDSRLIGVAVVTLWLWVPFREAPSQTPQQGIRIEHRTAADEIALHFLGDFPPDRVLEQSCDLQRWSLLGIPDRNPLPMARASRPPYFRLGAGSPEAGGSYFSILRVVLSYLALVANFLNKAGPTWPGGRGAVARYGAVGVPSRLAWQLLVFIGRYYHRHAYRSFQLFEGCLQW